MKKLSYLIVLALILGLVLTGCSLLSNISQVPATSQTKVKPTGNLAGAAKMPLWDSTGEAGVGYTCAGGALKINDGPYGFVILNTDASGKLIVEFALKNATANADFKLYVNQVDIDNTCTIKFPNIVGELTTNGQGNGNAHFDLPRWVGADNFWVSAMELPMPYYPIHGLMLRSETVVLD